MDEVVFEHIVKYISISASIIGILIGVDLILGGKIALLLKKILDNVIYVDKQIAGFFSSIKKTLDKTAVNIDDKIMNANTRRIFGILFLFFSVIIIILLRISR